MSDFDGSKYYNDLEKRKKQYDSDRKDRKVIATIEVEMVVDFDTANDVQTLRNFIKKEIRENSTNIQYRIKGVSTYKYWDSDTP
jgi:LEA14-like dessication related protein